MKSILNSSATKRFILEKFKSLRPHMPITRVSQKDAIEIMEAEFRARIIMEVKRCPSIGKTFKWPKL